MLLLFIFPGGRRHLPETQYSCLRNWLFLVFLHFRYRHCFYFPYISSYPGTGEVWRESFVCTKDKCSNNICTLPGLYLLWRWNASSLPLASWRPSFDQKESTLVLRLTVQDPSVCRWRKKPLIEEDNSPICCGNFFCARCKYVADSFLLEL